MTLSYDAIGGLAIWDENDTFSDDPQNPDWTGLPYPPHKQFVDTDGYAVGGTSYPRGTLQIENEYEVLLTGSDGKT
ncbi:hypothetical protein [Paracoccus sp. SSK6]|uniref:hypothetical protein n=1 Tax=Paracoccus sp. SSK6 TaxID=3143131 RepID=UPI0032192E22